MKLGPYELDQIYHGDCVDLMAQLPDKCIDLVVTSPPYDNLRDYNGYTFIFEAVSLALWRIIKPGGVVVWVVGDETKNGSESGTSFRQALGFMELGFRLHDTMIYQREGMPMSHPRYEQHFEYMFVFTRGKLSTFNPILKPNIRGGKIERSVNKTRKGNALARPNRKPFVRKQRGIIGNIWKYGIGLGGTTSDKEAYSHPAIFPEALARDHIISWSNPGDIVLDPMCGSGTVLKMAKELGRQFLGFDISEEYCELSRRRVEGAKVPMFVPGENGRVEPVQLELGE